MVVEEEEEAQAQAQAQPQEESKSDNNDQSHPLEMKNDGAVGEEDVKSNDDDEEEDEDELIFVNLDDKKQLLDQHVSHNKSASKASASSPPAVALEMNIDVEQTLASYRQSPLSLSILSFPTYLHSIGLSGFPEHIRMHCYLEISHASRYIQMMEPCEERSLYKTLLKQKLAPPDEAMEHFDSIDKDIARTNNHKSAFQTNEEA